MRARGITVSLGADGAACNNRLDMFEEMRLAAMLQAVRRTPGALPARDVLWMATRGGARTLGLEDEIGSIESASAPTSSLSTATGRTSSPARIPTRRWSTPPAARTCTTTIVDGELLVDRGEPVDWIGRRSSATPGSPGASFECEVSTRGHNLHRYAYNAVSSLYTRVLMEPHDRARRVLAALVCEYIASGEPVSSRCSPAPPGSACRPPR